MPDFYVCVTGGATVGPVSTALLIKGIRHGKVPHDALVCRIGEDSWHSVAEIPELADALPRPEAFRDANLAVRYATTGKLGEGGMGEVYSCADEWIGREVAMKVVRRGGQRERDLQARFVREARLQGQLEHPAVVPVYDLGTRLDGAVFFTMKRVRGMTLARIIDGLRRSDREICSAYSRRRLLTAMSQVCLAVAFAHSRGVVHRDLKPENVMIGDFGEVYVLDWGLAKVLEGAWAGPALPLATSALPSDPRAAAAEAPAGQTQMGILLGSPGYAPPEQLRGEHATAGPLGDVYSLGAILFELLALEPMHAGEAVEALIASTLSRGAFRPSERATELLIPPELDEICACATALRPEDRFESARELARALERFLDGERDAERRHELAERHAKMAVRALDLASRGGDERERMVARGMQELGTALALDPTNPDALRMLSRVLLEAPAELPPEAQAELAVVDKHDRLRTARTACLVYSALLLTSPLMLWMDVRRTGFLLAFGGVHILTIAYTFWMWRTGKAERRYMAWAVALTFLLIMMMSTIFGPLVMVPGAAAVNAAAFLVGLRADAATRRLILIGGVLTVLIPTALQLSGLAPPSYVVEPGSIHVISNLVDFRPLPAMTLLTVSSVIMVVAAVYSVGRAAETLVSAERRNFVQAYRLRQILPARLEPVAIDDVARAHG